MGKSLPADRLLPERSSIVIHPIRSVKLQGRTAVGRDLVSEDVSLAVLGVGEETVVIERGDVLRAKPEPDLFLECVNKKEEGGRRIR